MLIDSHVNLHAPQFDEDREAVIDRARAAGVGLMVNICDKVSSLRGGARRRRGPRRHLVHGRHPSARSQGKSGPYAPTTLIDLAADPRVVGIGETGLDFHYDLSPRDVQAQVFRAHIAAARETGLPLVVHTREADEVMARDPGGRNTPTAPFRILMHCYTSRRGAGAAGGGARAPGSRSPASPPSRPPRTCAR